MTNAPDMPTAFQVSALMRARECDAQALVHRRAARNWRGIAAEEEDADKRALYETLAEGQRALQAVQEDFAGRYCALADGAVKR